MNKIKFCSMIDEYKVLKTCTFFVYSMIFFYTFPNIIYIFLYKNR